MQKRLAPETWLEELDQRVRQKHKKVLMTLVDSRYIFNAYYKGWSPVNTAEAINIKLTAARLKKLRPTKSKEVEPSLHLTGRLVSVVVESPQFSRPLTMTVQENKLRELCNGLREEGIQEFKVTVQRIGRAPEESERKRSTRLKTIPLPINVGVHQQISG